MNTSHTLRELFWENPMTLEATRTLRRFLRAGMSSNNALVGQRLNFALLGILGFLYLWLLLLIERTNEDLSTFLLICEAGLLTLAVPASLFGAIATEREKLTYDALIMTRLTPAQIVCGKLWWRVGMIVAMMGIFVPPLILSHLAGSRQAEYTFISLLWTQVQIFSWSMFVAAFSLWVSAKSKKGITSLLLIVSGMLSFLALVPALTALLGTLDRNSRFSNFPGYSPSPAEMVSVGLLRINPFVVLVEMSRHQSTGDSYWVFLGKTGIDYWVIPVFVLATLVLLRGAIKTLRGLEMPMTDNRKRGH